MQIIGEEDDHTHILSTHNTPGSSHIFTGSNNNQPEAGATAPRQPERLQIDADINNELQSKTMMTNSVSKFSRNALNLLNAKK